MCVLLSFIIQIQDKFKVENLFFSETQADKEYVISAQDNLLFFSVEQYNICMQFCLEWNNIYCFYAALLSVKKNDLSQWNLYAWWGINDERSVVRTGVWRNSRIYYVNARILHLSTFTVHIYVFSSCFISTVSRIRRIVRYKYWNNIIENFNTNFSFNSIFDYQISFVLAFKYILMIEYHTY